MIGDNIVLDCDGHILDGAFIESVGINLTNRLNVTIKNCIIRNYDTAVLLNGTNNSFLLNNTAYNNTGHGFHVLTSSFNILDDNTAHSNGANGFLLTDDVFIPPVLASHNNLTNNVAHNNSLHGFYVLNTDHNRLDNDTAYNNGFDGFKIEDSTLILFPCDGFCDTFSFNNITNSVSYNNSEHGFYVFNSANNTLDNDTAYNNGLDGFRLEDSALILIPFSENNVTNSFSYNNSEHGIYVLNTDNNVIENNTASGNIDTGIRVEGNVIIATSFNNVTNNTVFNNSLGIAVISEDNDRLANNTAFSNNYGIIINDAPFTSLYGDRLFGNNFYDMLIQNTGTPDFVLNASGLIFDNPAGNVANFTKLSINDSVEFGGYGMNWSTEPAPVPSGLVSFAGKFVNITPPSVGSASIESIIWHWLDSETPGYTESRFGLWEYDGAWTLRNGTPDTAANTLSLTDLSNFSIFAILDLSCPPPITSP
ncbi:MAG: right-handed parallel beta-helix repeat-containing protein, partial [Nitrososphaera sp.]|nr:right-handed parallel beta-helix repeat-containing protein [Nitrososphaera sp.]